MRLLRCGHRRVCRRCRGRRLDGRWHRRCRSDRRIRRRDARWRRRRRRRQERAVIVLLAAHRHPEVANALANRAAQPRGGAWDRARGERRPGRTAGASAGECLQSSAEPSSSSEAVGSLSATYAPRDVARDPPGRSQRPLVIVRARAVEERAGDDSQPVGARSSAAFFDVARRWTQTSYRASGGCGSSPLSLGTGSPSARVLPTQSRRVADRARGVFLAVDHRRSTSRLWYSCTTTFRCAITMRHGTSGKRARSSGESAFAASPRTARL